MEAANDNRVRKKNRMKSNTTTGLLFLLIGGALLFRQMGYAFPPWLFTWEMILILVGLFIGIQNKFRDLSWLILVIIGVVFLSDDIFPGISLRHYVAPVVIISLGLLFIFSPKRSCINRKPAGRFHGRTTEEGAEQPGEPSNEAALDIVSVFGGVKKRVLSKNFTGGDIVCIFGGSEINLTHADFTGPIVLDITQIFGGTTLIIPANWEVRSEVAAIFGGIDDKRPQSGNVPTEKILILNGTSIFGGIEIKSY